MIERMARAVCEQNTEYNGPKDSRTLQQRVDEEWPNWIDSATAALRELLQPTEGMVEAGGNVTYWAEGETMGDDRQVDVGTYVAEQVITAAIQAALKGE